MLAAYYGSMADKAHTLQNSYHTKAHIHSRNLIAINQIFSKNFSQNKLTILPHVKQRESLEF